MFLSDWRLLLRRWYVVLTGLLATVLLCFLATQVVPTKYEATSGLLLLPPPSTAAGVPNNPFLSLGGLDTVTGVLSRAATDRVTQEAVVKAGGTGSYTVEPDLASGGPVLLITVEDTTPAGALATLRVVTQRLPVLLADLQTTSGVRTSALIRSRELIRDDVAAPVRKPLVRALLAAAALGLAGTVLLASLVDGFLLRRAARREEDAEDAEPPVDEPAAEEPFPGFPLDEEVPRHPVEAEPRRNGVVVARGPAANGRAGAGPRSIGGAHFPPPFRELEPLDPGRPRWAPAADPDPTMEIAYGTVTDPDPTVEISYGRLEAELHELRTRSNRTEPR